MEQLLFRDMYDVYSLLVERRKRFFKTSWGSFFS